MRNIAKWTASCSASAVWLALALAAGAQPLRVRLNVDDPTFDLAGYEIAIQILIDRDDPAKFPGHRNDPVNWIGNSYGYFANLHNDFSGGGGCVHGSEVFLPWHRELLYRFEMALRAAKPGRTDDVTVPYWVWTEPPSGTGYPKAFENPTSPLFSPTRNASPSGHYTTVEIQKVIADNGVWVDFAGDACKLKPGCVSGNCALCPQGHFGAFESPFHNDMHDWLGTPMANPMTAAQDPIFWSFHAYIDLIYQQWQCRYRQPPRCDKCTFRAMTDRRVEDVIDVERQLGYVYDAVASCDPGSPPLLAAAPAVATAAVEIVPAFRVFDPPRRLALRAPGIGLAAAASPLQGVGPHVFEIRLPEAAFETADILLSGLTMPATFSYSGRVFLYPAKTKLASADAGFVARYQVGALAIWKQGVSSQIAEDHTDHPGARVRIDVTHALRYLAQAQPGTAWRIAVVFSAPSSLDAGADALTAAGQIGFTSAELVLDRDANE